MPSNIADHALTFATGFGFATIALALQRWVLAQRNEGSSAGPQVIDDRSEEVALSEVDLSGFDDLQIRTESRRAPPDDSSRGISRFVVKQCPECKRRVMLSIKKTRPSPIAYCGCGETGVMKEVNP